MESLSDLFKALSDPNRLRIAAALMRREELCACQITELIGVAGATASRHMAVLVSAGLVDSRKEGRWVHYRLCRDRRELDDLFAWIGRRLAREAAWDDIEARLERITACEPSDLSRQQRTRPASAIF